MFERERKKERKKEREYLVFYFFEFSKYNSKINIMTISIDVNDLFGTVYIYAYTIVYICNMYMYTCIYV